MNGEGKGKVVCVTGASGFIASWLAKLLLQRGYNVKATVRGPNDSKKTKHLLELDGAKERLRLFKAELLDEGCFDSIVEGCEGVFHTASPVFLRPADEKNQKLVDTAIKGTLNVLKSCSKSTSVKRVVMTSTIGTILFNGKPLTPDNVLVVDETWFSDAAICENYKFWYMMAKTLAEETGREFAKHHGIDLVIMNPGHVLGPVLQQNLNETTELILNLVTGKGLLPFNCFVDVRDVAFAHIQAFEIPSATGRYCLVESTVDVYEVLEILDELYSLLHLTEIYDIKPTGKPYEVSNEKIKSLGVNFMSLKVSLKDTIDSLKEKGFLNI